MNFLSIFVLIPLLMLVGLWAARSIKAVRGVMVAGSSALLISRHCAYTHVPGETVQPATRPKCSSVPTPCGIAAAAHLLLCRCRWHLRSHAAAVGHNRIYRYIRFLATATAHQGVFPLVHPACQWVCSDSLSPSTCSPCLCSTK